MSPKRGDDAPRRPWAGGEWRLRFATNEAAKGWGELSAEAPGNTRRCFEALRSDPVSRTDPDRQHRLRGRLSSGDLGGREYPQWEYEVTAGGREYPQWEYEVTAGDREYPQWEYEVTAGGRVRCLVDETRHTVHLVYASTRHPEDTE
ncbi:hypothetical protein [Streptomyces humi]|uniref:hypothetical protein n=1 Tax=Streptomyces humi TaxID=1428620 RepID=UPI00062894E2|nr:hypothetical protein [Streptomyces humi]